MKCGATVMKSVRPPRYTESADTKQAGCGGLGGGGAAPRDGGVATVVWRARVACRERGGIALGRCGKKTAHPPRALCCPKRECSTSVPPSGAESQRMRDLLSDCSARSLLQRQ